MKVFVETYGCTLNQADSDILKAIISQKHQIVFSENEADLIVINTCTVKGTTENKIIQKIESLEKKYVVAGCMSANTERLRRFSPLAPIVGTSSLNSINDAIDDAISNKPTIFKKIESKDDLPKFLSAPVMRIPINDGCLSSCNFCQTKLARPFLRSFSPKTIVKWINKSVQNGAKEIQLTSMDSGAYGRDIKTDVVALLDSIIKDNSFDSQSGYLVRLGMINPDHALKFSDDLVRILSSDKFYKFIHIPVQCGSEKVLKEMNRDHTASDFETLVRKFRKEVPEITIATDIIVGYPTETLEDYEMTNALLKKTKPDIINISKFSPRPGTVAKSLPQIKSEEVKRRSKKTSEIILKINRETRKLLIGKRYKVLLTEHSDDYKGRNLGYHQVVIKDFIGKLGEFVDVEIIDTNHNSLFGKVEVIV